MPLQAHKNSNSGNQEIERIIAERSFERGSTDWWVWTDKSNTIFFLCKSFPKKFFFHPQTTHSTSITICFFL